MDRNKDAKLTFEEFVEGSKQDPTIVQVSSGGHVMLFPDAETPDLGLIIIRWSRII